MPLAQESAATSSSLEVLRDALDSGAMRQVRRLVSALNPAEIADLLESLPLAQREIVWELVAPEDEGDVLVELNDEVRGGLLSRMDSADIVAAAGRLDLDDLADLLAELPEAVNREVLRSLDLSDRLRLQSVLEYDEDSAGGRGRAPLPAHAARAAGRHRCRFRGEPRRRLPRLPVHH